MQSSASGTTRQMERMSGRKRLARSTADFLLSSPLMHREYDRLLPGAACPEPDAGPTPRMPSAQVTDHHPAARS